MKDVDDVHESVKHTISAVPDSIEFVLNLLNFPSFVWKTKSDGFEKLEPENHVTLCIYFILFYLSSNSSQNSVG